MLSFTGLDFIYVSSSLRGKVREVLKQKQTTNRKTLHGVH